MFCLIQINASQKPYFNAFHRKKSRGNFRLRYSTLRLFVPQTMRKFFTKFCTNRSVTYKMTTSVTQSHADTRTFSVRLVRSIPCAAVYKLRSTLGKQERIITFRTHFDIFIFNTSLHYNIKYYFLKKYRNEII